METPEKSVLDSVLHQHETSQDHFSSENTTQRAAQQEQPKDVEWKDLLFQTPRESCFLSHDVPHNAFSLMTAPSQQPSLQKVTPVSPRQLTAAIEK